MKNNSVKSTSVLLLLTVLIAEVLCPVDASAIDMDTTLPTPNQSTLKEWKNRLL
ncbi:hypothetical protein [Pseudobacteroides cellulosolvens]|uniref:Uncharacterized protein n=1 Tax=Pseudobacteroides cellulosolvens ATCC 35603 = DSM 2933 TaxID=398512 RepID=A0A0L6JUG1_9FIRM|nr:hypothetical protein [Pseudobacteroides cellulosolvens]KNY29285.1 hypothetical protein Bccel_4559 [Pseudobacteroides cellulosolvens ATCC 35603 = DSM 2933]